jgi:uncharacterized protein
MSDWICNATPLIAFARIGELSLLEQVVGSLTIPAAVAAELSAHGAQGVGAVVLGDHPWIQVRSLASRQQVTLLLPTLDLGEAEVIALALEVEAPLVLIDEQTGRQVAKSVGLNVTGSVGLLIRAKQQKLIPAIRPLVEQMRQSGIYYSERFVQSVLREVGE